VNRPTVLAFAAGVPVAVLLLAGCGGSSGSSAAAGATPAPSASASASGAPGRGAARGPAASGEIAAVSGKTLQVQNTQAQTAVTWSASTAFTKTVPATLAAGDCVTATGTAGSGAALTATSVRVLATSGSCTLARGDGATPRARPSGGFGGRRGGASGAPARPSGAPGPGSDFATAFGKVTAVSGSTVTVSGRLLAFDRRSPGATPAPSASPAAQTVTVTLGASASVQRTAKATGADAKVGLCAVATGKADSAGAVAATAIALSAKGPDGCTAGFGGRFGAGGFGG
jgi:hypothetical protein